MNNLLIIAEMLKYQIEQHVKYAKSNKDFTEMTALQLIEQHAAAKACDLVLSNTLYMLTDGRAFGLTKREVIELAKLVPELRSSIISKYGYSHSRRDVFSEEQIKELK